MSAGLLITTPGIAKQEQVLGLNPARKGVVVPLMTRLESTKASQHLVQWISVVFLSMAGSVAV